MFKESTMSAEKSREKDAYLESIVERTIAPYRTLVTPEVLDLMREMVEESLTEDEIGLELLERARPRIAPDGSGVKPIHEEAAQQARAARRGNG